MRTFMLATALVGVVWFGSAAQAADRPVVKLLDNAAVSVGADVEVTPVRRGYGWRGYGYYPGGYRPNYGSYYRGYYPYRSYYGGYYRPYYSGYRYGYYGPGYGYYFR